MRFFVSSLHCFSTIIADLIPFRVQDQDELRTIPDIRFPFNSMLRTVVPHTFLSEITIDEVLSRAFDKVDLSLVYIAK